jgi:hypothetical protein
VLFEPHPQAWRSSVVNSDVHPHRHPRRTLDRREEQRQERGRIAALSWVLSTLDCPTKDIDVVGTPDPLIVGPPAQVYEASERPSVRIWCRRA